MAKHALRLVGADLGHGRDTGFPEDDAARLAREAARLGEIAASYALFGLRIDTLDQSAWTVEDDAPAPAPANDAEPAFPTVAPRGGVVHPAAPARALQALDWVFVLVVAQLAALWSTGAGLGGADIASALMFLGVASSLKLGLWATEAYRFSLARPREGRTIGGLTLGTIAGLFATTIIAPDARATAAFAVILPIAAMIIAAVHAACSVWIAALHRNGAFSENIVIVGATEAAERLAKRAARAGDVRVLAIVDDRRGRAPAQIGDVPVAGNLNDLLAWSDLPLVDRIVIAVPASAEARLRNVIKRLSVLPHRVDVMIDVEANAVFGRGASRVAGTPLACVSGKPSNHRRLLAKRLQDIVLGGLSLLALAPAMFAIAAAIKLDSKGPVLFKQTRLGFNKRAFTLFKFRSMTADGAVTRVGALLRRFGLDELPQLINVLRGDMSLVGPRPHTPDMKAGARRPDAILSDYAHRYRVKPGITGWAQINGSRGPVKTPSQLRQRVRHDLDYLKRLSLWFDLHILVRTPLVMWRDRKR